MNVDGRRTISETNFLKFGLEKRSYDFLSKLRLFIQKIKKSSTITTEYFKVLLLSKIITKNF